MSTISITCARSPLYNFNFKLSGPAFGQGLEIQKTMEEKIILDVCCGPRMMWFNKKHPNTIYMDIRREEVTACDGRLISIDPDIIGDFTNIPFPDNTFHHVVWDPPHMKKLGKNTWMAQKYGVLLPTWETDLKAGFDECMRVLKPNGTLIFKWSEAQITANKIIEIFGTQPLYGHPTAKHGKTIWLCFMKLSRT